MKKTLTAVAVGLALVAGQAVAANQGAGARVTDRLGATPGESSEFAGLPIVPLIAGIGVLTAIIVVASDDDSDSD